jgi:hypothetical protein
MSATLSSASAQQSPVCCQPGVKAKPAEVLFENFEVRNINAAEEVRIYSLSQTQILRLGPQGRVVLGEFKLKPGWKWSECVRPHVGTDLCMLTHHLYVTSGRLRVRMVGIGADASISVASLANYEHVPRVEKDIVAGDVVVLPPGHDCWVVGNEIVHGYDIYSDKAHERPGRISPSPIPPIHSTSQAQPSSLFSQVSPPAPSVSSVTGADWTVSSSKSTSTEQPSLDNPADKNTSTMLGAAVAKYDPVATRISTEKSALAKLDNPPDKNTSTMLGAAVAQYHPAIKTGTEEPMDVSGGMSSNLYGAPPAAGGGKIAPPVSSASRSLAPESLSPAVRGAERQQEVARQTGVERTGVSSRQ